MPMRLPLRLVGFAEGPVITPSGETFVISIDQGRVYRITESGAEVVADLGGANGATVDKGGKLYIARNGSRFSPDGSWWSPDPVGGVRDLLKSVLLWVGDADVAAPSREGMTAVARPMPLPASVTRARCPFGVDYEAPNLPLVYCGAP